MPFIGKLPDVGAFRLIDSITTSATDTYALQVEGLSYFPSSARNLIVSLNGVTQAPESAYTVSGSNIVFASALTASDVIDYILVIGESVDIGTPSDNTVGNAQLKSDLDFSGKTLTFSADQISGDAINGGTISSFASTGIDDNATSTALTVTDSGIAATLTTAAQPNITSVGTLGALTVSGDLTVDTNTLYVDSSAGLLGIGEPTPSRKLHVNAGSVQVTSIFESTSSNVFIDFANSATSEGRTRIGCEGADTLTFRTATAERLRISATGVLSITDSTGGNTNLEIYSSGTSGFLKGRRGVTTEIELGAADITFDSGGSTIMTMKNGGNVGIGITNPTSGNLVVATDSRSLGGTITARTNFQGSGWVFGDVVGRFAFDADDGPQDYTGTIESVVSQGGNYPYKTDLIFTTQTNGNRTEKLRIQENGGISFNGDTAAANALDDYEEGTWTPILNFGGGTSGITYANQIGRYTKIGNVVYVRAGVRISSKGTSTGNAEFSGLPFTVESLPYADATASAMGSVMSGLTSQIVFMFVNNQATGAFFDNGSTGRTNVTNNNFTNTTFIMFNGVYRTSQ